MNVFNIADMKLENGLTLREYNMTKSHVIPIGTLVEIDVPDHPSHRARLFVCSYQRDCDGTPLYGLTWNLERFNIFKDTPYGVTFVASGYDETSLIIIDNSNIES